MNLPYSEAINNFTDWTKEEINKMTNYKHTTNKYGNG